MKSNIIFLIWYSVKSLIMDLADLLSALKRAKTWSFILYATFFLAVWYKNYTLMKIALPLILLLYIIRQDKEPDFQKAKKDRAFLRNDTKRIEGYYEKYKSACYFSRPRKEPLNYEDYKKEELRKLFEKKELEE